MEEFERTLLTDNFLAVLSTCPNRAAFEVAPRDQELMTDVLLSVMQEATTGLGIRDEWDDLRAYPPGHGAEALRSTIKTGLDCELSIDLSGVFLNCRMSHEHFLSSVDDRFWRLLCDLVLDSGGKYELTQWPRGFASDPGDRVIARARKSTVFSMVADFILVSQSRDQHCGGPLIGNLEFQFDWAGKWSLITPKLREVASKTWKMSYFLYRQAYEWRKAMERRERRRLGLE